MKSKFIWIKIVLLFGVLATGFLFAASLDNKKETVAQMLSATLAFAETPTPPKSDKQIEYPNPQAKQQDKFQQDLLNLRNYRSSGMLEDLIAERNKIEQEWGQSGGEAYGKLSLEFLGVLTSTRYRSADDKALNLSQEYAIQALKKADTFELETEWHLLLYLRYPVAETALNDLQMRERRDGVKLWLHALRRLETEKDEKFDPKDLPVLNVTPPEGARVRFSGMSPESIEDPKLRAEYEKAIEANAKKIVYYNKQYRLRQDEDFILKNAVKYISKFYSRQPVNSEELEGLLNEFKIAEDIKKSIKTEISSAVQKSS